MLCRSVRVASQIGEPEKHVSHRSALPLWSLGRRGATKATGTCTQTCCGAEGGALRAAPSLVLSEAVPGSREWGDTAWEHRPGSRALHCPLCCLPQLLTASSNSAPAGLSIPASQPGWPERCQSLHRGARDLPEIPDTGQEVPLSNGGPGPAWSSMGPLHSRYPVCMISIIIILSLMFNPGLETCWTLWGALCLHHLRESHSDIIILKDRLGN